MDRAGKELEDLVRDIEQHLLPAGFKVEQGQRVFNDVGEQTAELDIVISGPLGSSSVSWLIECRDRPSEGAAPISWIEQLVSRRSRLNFDRVFAVSTTGFSPAAIDYAKKKIILRTVTRLTDIKSDFMIHDVVYHFECMDFAGPIQAQTADPSYKCDVEVVRPMLKRMETSEFLHLPVFVARHPSHVYPVNESAGLVDFKYDDWLDLKAGEEIIRIRSLRVRLRIDKFVKTSTALVATIYAEDGKPIWLEGEFEADTPKGKVKSRVQITTRPDGTQSAQTFIDHMPHDYFLESMAVYGRNRE